ncbi:Hpt domain-containing protein [Pseudoalteromonas piscicida]|uniref:Hpt domain-containing protein n=1 Tax=Pseudoalteromonas piscicida TaxID=43662 RepID=UPI0030957040
MTKTLNPQVLIDLIGDDFATAKKFYTDFLIQSKSSCANIKAAYQAGRFQALKDEAHYLKTSAKAVGAEVLAEHLQALEYSALDHNASACAENIKAIHHEIGSEFVRELKTYLSSHSNLLN